MTKTVRALGLVLVLSGAVLVGLSSDALTSMSADRGVSVDVASDPNAVVGLTYPNDVSGVGEPRTVELQSENADYGGCIFFFICLDYGYNTVELVRISDQLESSVLTIEELTYETTGETIVSVNDRSATGALRRVTMRARCPNGGGAQQAATSTVSMSIQATDESGTLSVELTRDIRVECVPD